MPIWRNASRPRPDGVGRTLLALLLAAALAPAVPARDALQAIDDCVARLDSDVDVGYARIAARCPELTPALTASGFAPWLPADWQRPDNELSAAGLSELHAQLARASRPLVSSHIAPRSERVGAVLAALARSAERPRRSWLQRLGDWLRYLITTRPREGEGWLSRQLAGVRLSAGTLELIGWAGFALVLALAAGIIVNELRIAGIFRRRAPSAAPGDAPPSASIADLAAIERALPQQRPALLLELIAARLAAQQRLPPARAFTARELEQHARLPQESARKPFAELVAVSERVRFSAEQVSGARLAAAVTDGRLLLTLLASGAAEPPAAA